MNIYNELITPGITASTMVKDLSIPMYNSFSAITDDDKKNIISFNSFFVVNDILYYRTQDTVFSYLPINSINSINAATASKLENTHKIWGQDFNGTQDVNGNLTTNGVVISSVNGIAPLIIASTYSVANLNADMIDGFHASDFILSDNCKVLNINYDDPLNRTTQLNNIIGYDDMIDYNTFVIFFTDGLSSDKILFNGINNMYFIRNKQYTFYINESVAGTVKSCMFTNSICDTHNVSTSSSKWLKICVKCVTTDTNGGLTMEIRCDELYNQNTSASYIWDGTAPINDTSLFMWGDTTYVYTSINNTQRDINLITNASVFENDRHYKIYFDFNDDTFHNAVLSGINSNIKKLRSSECRRYILDIYKNTKFVLSNQSTPSIYCNVIEIE